MLKPAALLTLLALNAPLVPVSASPATAGASAPASATAAAPAPASPVIGKIQQLLAKPAVLCGRFEQSKQLSGMKKPLAASGRFCVASGKGVLWRTLQPFASTLRLKPDEIVQYQGERVAMRLDARQEPTVRVINSVLFSLLAGDLSQLDKLFEVAGSIDGGNWKVQLKAREAGLAKVIGTIALEGGAYVKNITMQEASGDRTHIVFVDIQTGETALQPAEAALF